MFRPSNGNGNGQLHLDGEVLAGCPHCGEVILEMAEQAAYIRDLEREERVKRRRIGDLTSQIHATEDKDPLFPKAQQIYAYWRQQLAQNSREFAAKSRRAVLARLRAGWTLEELIQVIDGYTSRQYVVKGKRLHRGESDERYVDLELLCRDDQHVREGIRLQELDASRDSRSLREGSSWYMAQLCDCGHPRVHHLPPYLMAKFPALMDVTLDGQREPCLEPGCDCVTFDTVERDIKEWEQRLARKAARV